MKDTCEKIIRLGLTRNPKKIFDEVDSVTAAMLRDGWLFKDSIMEESLGNIHLLFERELTPDSTEETLA